MLFLSSSPKVPRRHLTLPPLIHFAVVCLYFSTPQGLSTLPTLKIPVKISWFYRQSKFWHSFAPVLVATAPICSSLQNTTTSFAHVNRTAEVNTTAAQITCLHRSHALFVDIVNFGSPRLDFVKGTSGIAILASGLDFPVLLVNIYMLRRTGSELPVEVFLETEDDYEPDMCEVVLLGLNAKCVILSFLLESSSYHFEIARHQMRIFAIIFSSFEDVLFLDEGTFFLRSPDELFESELFASDGLVVWPGIESSPISPQMSEITGLDEDPLPGIPAIDHRQVFISKSKHAQTLSMAAYYAVYGAYYDRLLGQHNILSIAAANMNKPFHRVKQLLRHLGADSTTSATVQFTPITDLNCSIPCMPQAISLNTNWLSSDSGFLKALNSPERLWGTAQESQSLAGEDIEANVWALVTSIVCKQDTVFFPWDACREARMRRRLAFAGRQVQQYDGFET